MRRVMAGLESPRVILDERDRRPEVVTPRPAGQPDPRPVESAAWASWDVVRVLGFIALAAIAIAAPAVGVPALLGASAATLWHAVRDSRRHRLRRAAAPLPRQRLPRR
ncbi:MAG: hypothetical protein ABR520_01565 [Mycobacteriales bacterium]|nr:hypothetical protein [Frankia sp.]